MSPLFLTPVWTLAPYPLADDQDRQIAYSFGTAETAPVDLFLTGIALLIAAYAVFIAFRLPRQTPPR